jgi:hypothetical protein
MFRHYRAVLGVVHVQCLPSYHSRRLRVASGVTAPGPTLEGAPRFRPKVVLMSLSSYILR